MKTFHGVFYDFKSKVENALQLEDALDKAKQEAELLKEEILNEPKLHAILTTVGIVHDKVLYKKVAVPHNENRPHDKQAYSLDVEEYVDPVQSFQLDAKLGDNNE